MEIFAQWLDDIDDMVFAAALVSERVRLRCLELGLLAALLLVNVTLSRLPAHFAAVLTYAAAASLVAWLLTLLEPAHVALVALQSKLRSAA
jgi:hypothetical protein